MSIFNNKRKMHNAMFVDFLSGMLGFDEFERDMAWYDYVIRPELEAEEEPRKPVEPQKYSDAYHTFETPTPDELERLFERYDTVVVHIDDKIIPIKRK